MFGENTRFVRLTEEHEIKPFDCGDDDLNEFLLVDARFYLKELLAVTYLIESDSDTIAFFSLSNDRIALDNMDSNAQWNKLRRRFPQQKRLRSYPSVKIGRIGVSRHYSNCGYGSKIMNYIKFWFTDVNKTGCRFITVDSYQSAIGFYEKNGFDFLSKEDEGQLTRLMYFDLMSL
jgi:GNAT superfamily N-acetyltransferase